MSEVRLKISPPWVTYINKLQALFDGDPQIAFNVDWSALHPSVIIATNNPEKAAALERLLPNAKGFGNVALTIEIDCPEVVNLAFATAKDLFETAFKGNPAFAYVVVPEGTMYAQFTYVVFKNCVVQFFNDNLNDPHGVLSTLYQDIAEEIFEEMQFPKLGVCYCTDVETKLGKSPAEWIG